MEVHARDEAEAQATVEAKLQAQGHTWESITIVKGRDPGPWKHARDRYAVELQTMLGRLHINAASPSEPQPMWVYNDPTYNEDTTARTMWAKFMDESSHGLSVSDFPRFIIPDVDGSRAFPLPPADVQNMGHWDRITSAVHEHLDFWKSRLLERIERLDKINGRSAEEAEQLKRGRANLKALKRFDKWSYQDYAGQLLPDMKPHPLDLDNPRLYWLSNGKLIPIGNLGPDQLRVDFWRRSLTLWDGPVDKRADNLRTFLDHHHRNGGKPEVFRDLVKDTLARIRKLTGRELLVEKMEGWLSTAEANRKAEIERAITKPTPFALVRGPKEYGEAWIREGHLPIYEGQHGPFEPVTMDTFQQWETYVATYFRGSLKPPLSITPFGTPWDGGKPMDLFNPFRLAENWKGTGKTALLCNVEPSDVGNVLMWEFREDVLQRWNGGLMANPEFRKGLVRFYLDHHAVNCDNETVYLSVVEQQFLEQVPRAPRGLAERIAKGEVRPTVPDALKAEVSAWLAERRKALTTATKAEDPSKWPDLKSLALFYAFRCEADETSADITKENASEIAKGAGFTKQSSGKELKTHFGKYAWGTPENKRRERTKEGKRPGDVLKRFDTVIAKLAPHAEALALAQEERKIVRNRSNANED